jgi:predicted branched-subunit amino acid permease
LDLTYRIARVRRKAWAATRRPLFPRLRFLVFSYQYRPYFAHLSRRRRVVLSYFMGDTIFAMFLRRYPEPKREPGQLDYFWGAALANYGAWQLAVIAGHRRRPRDPARVGRSGSPAPWRCWR